MVRKLVSVEDFISIFNLMGTYHWLVDEDAEGNGGRAYSPRIAFLAAFLLKRFMAMRD